MNNYKDIYKDLPQLIVALDKDNNYIHIRDAKEEEVYYCPCCHGLVKPRAYKCDKDYEVQPHYYHASGGCSDETRLHWLYKNWLFKYGSQFYIQDKLYTVDHVEIEKSHKTSFGIYRPDITVYTVDGQTMYFEINFTSAKTETNYFCKWDELHNDVIEVNIKKIINEDYNCEIPTFSLIYSNGECYKLIYKERDDYANIINNRKEEWKRQDAINYKIKWEKLDWFWIKLQDYKENYIPNDSTGYEEILSSFNSLDFDDIEDCWNIVGKISCLKQLKANFRDIVNNKVKDKYDEFLNNISIKYNNILSLKKDQCYCVPKRGIYISFMLNENYIIKDRNIYIRFDEECREWCIKPSILMNIMDDFKIKEAEILVHISNLNKLKDLITWNKYPLLFNSFTYLDEPYCDLQKLFLHTTNNLITDFDTFVNQINKNYIDIVNTYLDSKLPENEMRNIMYSVIDALRIQYEELNITNTKQSISYFYSDFSYLVNISYLGKTIFKIDFQKCSILINNDFKVNYSLVNKQDTIDNIITYINNNINSIILTMVEVLYDIYLYSNNKWDFIINEEKKYIELQYHYYSTYYSDYKKRNLIISNVNIEEFFIDGNININNCMSIKKAVMNKLSIEMYKMLENEVKNYNKNNINSMLIMNTGGTND